MGGPPAPAGARNDCALLELDREPCALQSGSASASAVRAVNDSQRGTGGLGTAPAHRENVQSFKASIGSLLALSLASCVAQGKYDAAVADATRARARLEASDQERHRERGELDELRQEVAQLKVEVASSQQELDFASGIAMGCGEALEEQTSLNEDLSAQLERLGKDVDALAASKGELATSLERARAGLEGLRHEHADSEARAELFRNIAQRLRRMVDGGELKIVLRSGRMVLVLPSDILFDSGKVEVGRKGRRALSQVGAVLGNAPGRRFQVSGHTDTDPIRASGFASNWELSSARALQVVHVLIGSGMRPAALSAAGYAEFDPIAANDTPANKARNRRIEIALQPNIDELVELPAAGANDDGPSALPAPDAEAPATVSADR
jgi:chemotaxis protein MotB